MSSAPEERAKLIEALSLSVRKVIVDTVLLFDTLAGQIGLNATDMQCLNILDFEGPVPAGRLADLTGLTTGAITTAIDRLEKAGYVQRVRDPHDRRRVLVQPVPHEGVDVFGAIDEAWRELCSRYSDQELATVLNFIDAMHQMNHSTSAEHYKGAAAKKTDI
ncbi:MAG: MarR family winged helix-turn-helix transcriptional regulator [Ktedonobacterales bacterium]